MNNLLTGITRLRQMVFRRVSSAYWSLWRAPVPWYNHVRDVAKSSTVAATVMWCARNFPEAPPALWTLRAEDGQREPVRDHPLLRLLRRPNQFITGTILWMATVTDWKMTGNAYWLKIRNNIGEVVELWWLPSWMVEPVGDPGDDSVFIAAYIYTPTDQPLRIDPLDIVHFRFGMDEENPRKGSSPLRAVLREVFTDDEASKFTGTMLVNHGVPGVIISPDPSVKVTDDDIEKAKKDFDEQFTGPRRGAPMVMKGATKVNQFGFSPDQMLLTELRRVPEERVTACLGVPAIVVGLGAGLDRSTFTNMGEAQEYAYQNGLIPDQRIMADAVHWQLLTDFVSEEEAWGYEFGFDLTKVRALQEDMLRQAQAWATKVNAGYAMVSEARRGTELEVIDQRDDVFLRAANMTQVSGDKDGPAGQSMTLKAPVPENPAVPEPPAGTPAPPNGNGAVVGLEAGEIADVVVDRIRTYEATEGRA